MIWYEVWADDGLAPPYILVLAFDGAAYRVVDPQERRRVVHTADSYDEACSWLAEDEYTKVVGRMAAE